VVDPTKLPRPVCGPTGAWLLPGPHPGEKFEVVHPTGDTEQTEYCRGGQATVARARVLHDGRPTEHFVAVKWLLDREQDQAARLENEITQLRILKDDPGVVRFRHAGTIHQHAGAPRFLAMQWMEGGTVLDWIGTSRQRPETVLVWAKPVAETLDRLAIAAGSRKAIHHRDVKPSNILLERRAPDVGRVVLSDFGVATGASGLTKVLQSSKRVGALGSEDYRAPETDGGSDYSLRSDQYSLARSMLHAMLGTTEFRKKPLKSLADRLGPVRCGPVVEPMTKALSDDPEERFRTCSDFVAAFAAVVSPPPLPARATPAPRAPAPSRPPARAGPPDRPTMPGAEAGRLFVGEPLPDDIQVSGWQRRQAEALSKKGWRIDGRPLPVWLRNGLGMRFVLIPPGRCRMGAPESEAGSSDDERPVVERTIQAPFYLGTFPVTNGQFRVVFPAHRSKSVLSGSDFDLEGLPAVGVVHSSKGGPSAHGFLQHLNEAGGGSTYRLPYEEEWEYACRGREPGDERPSTPFWRGRTITTEQANFDGTLGYAGGPPSGEYRKVTTPEGTFAANPWGLRDLHGNVWERTGSVYTPTHPREPLPTRTDDPTDSSTRVLRGGSWSYDPGFARSAYRLRCEPGVSGGSVGFRVALSLAPLR
jgi:formylglycine-generating enzyme required for sulfatase activity